MNQQEKQIVSLMIDLYCKKNHHTEGLCESCQKLKDYAMIRLEKCMFADDKPTCQSCSIHCYKPEMKAQIKSVMRFSGPRMILYHPIYSAVHLYKQIFKKRKK